MLTEEEFYLVYQNSSAKYINDLLGEMVDKDLLNVDVNEEGEFTYSINENGKQILDNNKITIEPK
jgi:predicted transcriptional regulator